ncbi:hypothetical protein DBP18_06225 [Streptomyces sp. CS081A]|nr:hypothetical protein DBP18_06225 [Streptomyces sp. CS081A]
MSRSPGAAPCRSRNPRRGAAVGRRSRTARLAPLVTRASIGPPTICPAPPGITTEGHRVATSRHLAPSCFAAPRQVREGKEGGRTAHAAAGHAAVGLTGTAALEHAAQGVRINAVGPGRVDTPLLAGIGREAYGARAAR